MGDHLPLMEFTRIRKWRGHNEVMGRVEWDVAEPVERHSGWESDDRSQKIDGNVEVNCLSGGVTLFGCFS